MGFKRQIVGLLTKQLIIKKTHFWKQTIWEFIIPVAFGAVLAYLTIR
jgi:hypothetical protein